MNKEVDFRSWHCGRQGGEVLIKNSILDHGIVERQGGGSLNKDLEFRSWQDFRLWHSGWQGKGSLNKEVDFRSWHCGRQGGEKFK